MRNYYYPSAASHIVQYLFIKKKKKSRWQKIVLRLSERLEVRKSRKLPYAVSIHKPNNPGRPIVSACSCPTELISSYLDKIMAPIVKTLPSYIKDSQHALEIFRDFSFLGQNKLIFTMDITSLYTVIPNDEGLRALKHFSIFALLGT